MAIEERYSLVPIFLQVYELCRINLGLYDLLLTFYHSTELSILLNIFAQTCDRYDLYQMSVCFIESQDSMTHSMTKKIYI